MKKHRILKSIIILLMIVLIGAVAASVVTAVEKGETKKLTVKRISWKLGFIF